MKARFLISLSVLLAVVSVYAQGMMGSLMSPSPYNTGLLLLPSVQKEIHLSGSVAAKIRANSAATNKLLMQSFTMKPGAVDPKKIQQNRAVMTARLQKDSAVALAFLTPVQKKRLREISLQAYGAGAVLIPTVEKELGLTPSQHKAVEALMQKQASEAMGLWRKSTANGKPRSPAQSVAITNQIKKKANEGVKKILTGAQRAKWTAMLGKPFDLAGMYKGMAAVPSARS